MEHGHPERVFPFKNLDFHIHSYVKLPEGRVSGEPKKGELLDAKRG